MIRMQYNKYWLEREPLEEVGKFQHKVTSKYMPHQGKQEMARRRKQMGIEEKFIYNPR